MVKTEELGAGSAINTLFNDFYKLNKVVLSTPIQNRDAGFINFCKEQSAKFYEKNKSDYGNQLKKEFDSFLERNPFVYMNLNKGTEEYQFFMTFWLLHKKYWNGYQNERTEQYWEDVVAETSKITGNPKLEQKYSVGIILTFLSELEKKDREERKYGKI